VLVLERCCPVVYGLITSAIKLTINLKT